MKTKANIALLAKIMWQRKLNQEPPFILLIGAGASISSGGSTMIDMVTDVVQKYGEPPENASADENLKLFYQILGRMGEENRYTILRQYFLGKVPSEGYRNLAKLIKNGYFRIIFTTNFDTFLEEALYDAQLRTCDFQTLICGKDQPEAIQELIGQPTPQIKVIKLHGDLHTRKLAILPEEIFQFQDTLNPVLTEYFKGNLLVIGHHMLDNDINRTITASGGDLWYVNPAEPSLSQFGGQLTLVRKSHAIIGEAGHFDHFFQTLDQELESFSNRQKATMNSPKSETTDFENRIYDLDFLLDPSKPRFIGIDAPAGYGKSYLLQEIKRRLRDKANTCLEIDLAQNEAATRSIETLLKEIAWQGFEEKIQGEDPDRLETEVIRFFVKSKHQEIRLMFDTLNQLQPETTSWLRDQFIPKLDSALADYHIKLRLILAGRYLTAEWSKANYALHVRRLDPFDEAVIKEMTNKFAKKHVGHALRTERVDSITREIFEISGGHPKAIRSILEEMAENLFVSSHSFREHKRLFNKHVAYIIDNIFQEIPQSIRNCLKILSVFRKFNADTIDALIAEGKIFDYYDGADLLPHINRTRLINRPTATKPMYSDRIVRRILCAELKFSNQEQFAQLNQFAENLFNHWLRSEDLHGKLLPVPVGDQWQLIFIVESLYHSLQGPLSKSKTRSGALIVQKFQDNLAQLKSTFSGNLPNLGIQLKDALTQDREIANSLKYACNTDIYETILELVQHYIDNKGVVE